MGAITHIGWCDASWNPIGGCSIKSHGCNRCYAQRIAGSPRLADHPLYKGVTTESKAGPVFNGKLTVAPDDHPIWTWPIRWRGSKFPKAGAGQPSMIFVGDMSDLFHEDRPTSVIDKVVASCIYSRHICQLLTKRADVMRAYFTELKASGRWLDFAHPMFGKPNFDPAVAEYERVFSRLWLGISAEDQTRADERIADLLATPAAIRFVSAEPLLGPIDFHPKDYIVEKLSPWYTKDAFDPTGSQPVKDRAYWLFPKIDWCIVGGESGPDFRPMKIEWAESAAKQFKDAGTPIFVKQDNGKNSGAKGRFSDEMWALKEFPVEPPEVPLQLGPDAKPERAQGELL